MTKPRKAWMFSPDKASKTSLPGSTRADVDAKANALIENVLKPKHIEPPPKGHQLNYLVDIKTKWIGSKCYFVSTYRSPGPHAQSSRSETKFARMEALVHAAHRHVGRAL